MFAQRRKKSYSDPRKQRKTCGFLQSGWCKRKSAFSCTVDTPDHGGALVGQSWGLLIYTFHKTIHVQGIPLPIWLGRTRGRGGGTGVQSKTRTDKQWRGLVSIYANMWAAINRTSFDSATKRSNDKLNYLTAWCLKTFHESLPAPGKTGSEKRLLFESRKHHPLSVTYLKWSKEEVKLPRFNVNRQTADKQCSYL